MRCRVVPVGEASAAAAGRLVKEEGGLIAFPTDTVYGLGCDPMNGTAVERLFEAKGRDAGKPVPVLFMDLRTASKSVELQGLALELAERYWPGPLTIVAPLKVRMPTLLHQGSNWLGCRVPGGEDCLALIRSSGGCITGTSANLSGRPSCRTAGEVAEALGSKVDLIIDGGRLAGAESTVVKVVGGGVEVLRRGQISLESGRAGR